MVQVRLNGFLPPDFVGEETPLLDVTAPPEPERRLTYPPVEIQDARALQVNAASEAHFFAEHGFLLLPHATEVRDWDNDVGPIYLPEIEKIICERLLPDRRI